VEGQRINQQTDDLKNKDFHFLSTGADAVLEAFLKGRIEA
jgi:hypothetical protein